MNNVIKSKVWGVLIVLLSHVCIAQTNSDFEVSVTGLKTFEVISSTAKGNVDLSLINENGEVIYRNRIENNGAIKKRFDLVGFPDGRYQMDIADNEKKYSLPLTIEGNVLEARQNDEVVSYFPRIDQKDRMVWINMMALNGEDLKVTVYNSQDEMMYREMLSGNEHLGRILDFSSSEQGNYEIQLLSNKKLVTKTIAIH